MTSLSRQSSLKLGSEVGSGSYGTVYRGRFAERKAAFKKFRISQNEGEHEAIQREVQMLAGLKCRHIIQFIGTTYHNGAFVLVTDFAEGGNLKRAIEKDTLPDWATRERISQEIASGLAYLHYNHILHRDLKSANVLLTRHLEVRLCDFGLAVVKTTSASHSTDTVRGTIRWMAPELHGFRPKYSTKSDVYALGMVMWEMAANCTTPFKEYPSEPMVVAVIKRGVREEIPDSTPQHYRWWIERCWKQEPHERPEAGEMVIEDIEIEVEGGTGVGDRSMVSAADELEELHISSPSIASTTSSSSGPSGGHDNATGGSNTMERTPLSSPSGPPAPLPVQMEIGQGDFQQQPTDELITQVVALDGIDVEAQVALATMYEQGSAGIAKDDTKAFKWYRRAARQGHIMAQYRVAEMCSTGQGIAQNDSEAAAWFRKAADQGNVSAQASLGMMYLSGRGVEQNDYEAMTWFRKAAENDDPEAQGWLGFMYAKGRGVEQSDIEAAFWLRRAASHGNAIAQFSLGTMYESGRGVEQDFTEAASWYRLAGEKGSVDAQHRLAILYQNGHGVVQSDTEAVAWYRKAANQGHADAQFILGALCQNGKWMKQNDVEAAEWYKKAADQGHPEAQFYLGVMYSYGRGVDRSDIEAATWISKAANQGHALAQNDLGWRYLKGLGVPPDDGFAVYWLRKAARQELPQAQYRLAGMYGSGKGVNINPNKAFSYYYKAAQSGYSDAQAMVGHLYFNGIGIKQDYAKAMEWSLKAAQQGHPGGQFDVGTMYERGLGVGINLPKAFDYYQKAAAKGHELAKQRAEQVDLHLSGRTNKSLMKIVVTET
ncbi:hypothetical protein BGW42_003663 [Actinomortierella wolfii]|nr:hypothetical protein BGW42_003663 [Actinomortierella wolfii]